LLRPFDSNHASLRARERIADLEDQLEAQRNQEEEEDYAQRQRDAQNNYNRISGTDAVLDR
jgi:hypothetical protein